MSKSDKTYTWSQSSPTFRASESRLLIDKKGRCVGFAAGRQWWVGEGGMGTAQGWSKGPAAARKEAERWAKATVYIGNNLTLRGLGERIGLRFVLLNSTQDEDYVQWRLGFDLKPKRLGKAPTSSAQAYKTTQGCVIVYKDEYAFRDPEKLEAIAHEMAHAILGTLEESMCYDMVLAWRTKLNPRQAQLLGQGVRKLLKEETSIPRTDAMRAFLRDYAR